MKKSIIILTTILIIILIGSFYIIIYCVNQTNNYYKNFYDMETKKFSVFSYDNIGDRYLEEYGQYAEDRNELIDLIKELYQEDSSWVIQAFLKDTFSNEKEFIQYYPVYDKTSKEIVSYIFLSAGIDGKINNALSEKDTLYYNDWQFKLKTYNGNLILSDESNSFFGYPDFKFNLKDRFFGKKDYVIMLKKVTELQ